MPEISSISGIGEDVLEDDDPAVPLYNYLEAGGGRESARLGSQIASFMSTGNLAAFNSRAKRVFQPSSFGI